MKDGDPGKRIINDVSPTTALVTITWRSFVDHGIEKDNPGRVQHSYKVEKTEIRVGGG